MRNIAFPPSRAVRLGFDNLFDRLNDHSEHAAM